MENKPSPVTMDEKRTSSAPCAICAAPWVATPYGSKLEPHAPGCRYAGLILCPACGHPSALIRPECKSENHPTSESPLTASEVEAMRKVSDLDWEAARQRTKAIGDAVLRGLEGQRVDLEPAAISVLPVLTSADKALAHVLALLRGLGADELRRVLAAAQAFFDAP